MEKMALIKELNDQSVLGTDGLSLRPPRKTARAIVINSEGLFAVMHEEKFGLHTLPGGGIETDEDIIEALRREVLEETGCICDIVYPLGRVHENRFHADFTTISYWFIVETKTKNGSPQLTEAELTAGTKLKWCTFDETIHLIRDCEHDTNQKKFLQARDMAALEEYAKRNGL